MPDRREARLRPASYHLDVLREADKNYYTGFDTSVLGEQRRTLEVYERALAVAREQVC